MSLVRFSKQTAPALSRAVLGTALLFTVSARATPTDLHAGESAELASPETSSPHTRATGKQVFRGALTACRNNGPGRDFRELPDRVKLKPMRVISILMTQQDGIWRPSRADDANKRCEWVFTNAKSEIVGRLYPPGKPEDDISVVWGPMCGQPGGKFMYVPGLKNPWVYVPSCSVQSDPKFVPIVAVDEGETKDGREHIREIPIPPDPDWRSKYGFLEKTGKKVAGDSPAYRMAEWALRGLANWQKLKGEKPSAVDAAPEPNPPADGRASCKSCS